GREFGCLRIDIDDGEATICVEYRQASALRSKNVNATAVLTDIDIRDIAPRSHQILGALGHSRPRQSHSDNERYADERDDSLHGCSSLLWRAGLLSRLRAARSHTVAQDICVQ